jgi:hypothetical protein
VATISANFSIDPTDHLIVSIPAGVGSLDVENGLAGASQQFPTFSTIADLGPASPGVYAFLLTLNGADSCSAVVSISGLPGQLSVVVGTPAAATQGAFGFDTDTPLTDAQISVLKANFNYTFCLRYVSRGPAPASDISAGEVGRLLAADVALMLVQHPPLASWTPTTALGTTWGAAAVSNASSAAVAKGVTLFCDLEGVDSSVPASGIIGFCNAWAAIVKTSGFIPGLYVGADCGLTVAELSGLNFPVFWKSCSVVPTPLQGFSMTQGPCDVTRGDANVSVGVDENTVNTVSSSLVWLKRE